MTEELLKELNRRMQAIENLLILQLIQNGATAKQIGAVLQIEKVAPTNIPKSFSITDLKKKNVKEE